MEKENREEVKEEYPNLAQAPVYLNIKKFNINADLSTATDRQLKTLIEKKLGETRKADLNPEYDINRKEKILLVPRSDLNNVLFEKTMIIPRHLRG